MAKSVQAMLRSVNDVAAIIGLKTSDVNYISIYGVSTSWVTAHLSREGFLRAMLKLAVPSDRIGRETRSDGSIRYAFVAKGIDFYTSVAGSNCIDEYECLIKVRKLKIPAARKEKPKPKPAPKPETQATSNFKKPTDSAPVPRSVREARDFLWVFYHLPIMPSDDDLLDYAKRGQIKYHPDRPTADPHLSRVFNAAATLLKGVLR